MNTRDSEALAGLLRDAGFMITDSKDKADVVLFNTCSVRQHAEDKVWSEIGRFKPSYQATKLPSKKPIIGVVGCMAQNYKQEIFKRAPQVDLVVGPNDLLDIPLLIKQILRERTKALAVSTMEREQDFYVSDFRKDKQSAYVVISEGCSNFCSYCVVPFARGRLHNRSYQTVLDEIEKTVESGIKNITLLGQNVNAYVSNSKLQIPNSKQITNSKFQIKIQKSDKKINFIELLKLVNGIDGLKEFSFITSHPKDSSVELFYAMRDLKKLKKFLHLPVQSGSDRILKMMNRGYASSDYINLAENYRKIVKGGKLTTDIIVGFPTESEEDFLATKKLMEQIQFDSAYIFKYSPRPHTKAEELKDDVPKKEKERRHKILLELQKRISLTKK